MNEQKQTRRALKQALRAAVTADYKARFPRLNGKRLRFLVNQKADMMYAAQRKQLTITGIPTLEAVEAQ